MKRRRGIDRSIFRSTIFSLASFLYGSSAIRRRQDIIGRSSIPSLSHSFFFSKKISTSCSNDLHGVPLVDNFNGFQLQPWLFFFSTFFLTNTCQPLYVQLPNLRSHFWSSNGNHVISILHVLLKIPGGTQRQLPVCETTTLVWYVPSNFSSALKNKEVLLNFFFLLLILYTRSKKYMESWSF